MALIKKHSAPKVEAFPVFDSLEEAVAFYETHGDFGAQSYAVEEISRFEEGGMFLVGRLVDHPHVHKDMLAKIASVLAAMDSSKAPIQAVMELLKIQNAYVRNLAISILQDYGDEIMYYIVKFLIGDDRDLRIFAINVLGDVNFPESRQMLLELLATEEDVNVAMTAVDYLAEIGEEEDIGLLESMKTRFPDDTYVTFAVDGAIRSIRG